MTETDEVTEAGGQQGAPGALEDVRAFVNTYDVDDGVEELQGPEELVAFLAGRGLAPAGATASDDDVTLARRMREALRALLAHNAGEPLDKDALPALEEAAAACAIAPRFTPESIALASGAPGVRGALGRLLTVVADAMADGTWPRLKVCRRESCRWAFYDLARNRTGKWCSMAVCGNRTKAERYRSRHTHS